MNGKPRMLDLFSGDGGCAVGYAQAGFNVVGVDIHRKRHYPYEFHQAGALEWLEHFLAFGEWPAGGPFDAIHASPPCQAHSVTKHSHAKQYPDLLAPTRLLIRETGLPYIIENVPGATMPDAIELCGSAFGLSAHDPATNEALWLKRHRWFESNAPLLGPGGCFCKHREIGGVYGGGSSDRNHAREVRRGGYTPAAAVRKALMGIGWMPQDSLSQAIPPAYTEFLGTQLLEHLNRTSLTKNSR